MDKKTANRDNAQMSVDRIFTELGSKEDPLVTF